MFNKKNVFTIISLLFLSAAGQGVYAQKNAPQAQVAPFGYDLFTISGNVGSVTAQMRAENIENNIRALKNELLFNAENFAVIHTEESENIVYKGKVIAGITAKQAALENRDATELAREYLSIIIRTLEHERTLNKKLYCLKKPRLYLYCCL